MSQRNIIYTIRFTEKEWKRLEQKIRENDEWKFKYGTKEGRVNIAAYIRDVLFRKEMEEIRYYRETLWTRTQKADHETGAADNK